MKHSADKKSPPASGATKDNLTINAGAAKPIKAKITPAEQLSPKASKVVNTNEAPEAHDGFAAQFAKPEPGSKTKRSMGFRGVAIGVIVLLLVGAFALSLIGGSEATVAEAPVVEQVVAPVPEPVVVEAPIVVEAPVVVAEPVIEEPAPVVEPVIEVAAPAPVVVEQATDANDLVAQMTAGVMSALQQPSRAEIAAAEASGLGEGLQHSELYNLVTTALVQGQSETYIDLLINDAANSGRIDVPDALRTADGKVNTAAILAVVAIR